MDLLSQTLNLATVSSRRIGEFMFDLVTAESHVSRLNVTENPIETGASISDHAFLAPKEVTITGIMVSYEPPADLSNLIPDIIPGGFPIPLPVNIQAVTAQAIALANQVLSVVNQVTEAADRVIAPFLPNFSGSGGDVSPTTGRIRQAYTELLNIQKSGELTEVMTGLELYQSMAITSITVTQTNDGAGEFTITLREVFIVETQTASGLNAKGRAGNQSSGTANKGRTQPESVISSTTGAVREALGW